MVIQQSVISGQLSDTTSCTNLMVNCYSLLLWLPCHFFHFSLFVLFTSFVIQSVSDESFFFPCEIPHCVFGMTKGVICAHLRHLRSDGRTALPVPHALSRPSSPINTVTYIHFFIFFFIYASVAGGGLVIIDSWGTTVRCWLSFISKSEYPMCLPRLGLT